MQFLSSHSPQAIIDIINKRKDFVVTNDNFFLDLFPRGGTLKLKDDGSAYAKIQKRSTTIKYYLLAKLILKITPAKDSGSSIKVTIRQDTCLILTEALLLFGLIYFLIYYRSTGIFIVLLVAAIIFVWNLLSFIKDRKYFKNFTKQNLL